MKKTNDQIFEVYAIDPVQNQRPIPQGTTMIQNGPVVTVLHNGKTYEFVDARAFFKLEEQLLKLTKQVNELDARLTGVGRLAHAAKTKPR